MKNKARCFCLFLIVCCFFTSFAYAEDDIESLTKQALALAESIQNNLITADGIVAEADKEYEEADADAQDKLEQGKETLLAYCVDSGMLEKLMVPYINAYTDAINAAKWSHDIKVAEADPYYKKATEEMEKLDEVWV